MLVLKPPYLAKTKDKEYPKKKLKTQCVPFCSRLSKLLHVGELF